MLVGLVKVVGPSARDGAASTATMVPTTKTSSSAAVPVAAIRRAAPHRVVRPWVSFIAMERPFRPCDRRGPAPHRPTPTSPRFARTRMLLPPNPRRRVNAQKVTDGTGTSGDDDLVLRPIAGRSDRDHEQVDGSQRAVHQPVHALPQHGLDRPGQREGEKPSRPSHIRPDPAAASSTSDTSPASWRQTNAVSHQRGEVGEGQLGELGHGRSIHSVDWCRDRSPTASNPGGGIAVEPGSWPRRAAARAVPGRRPPRARRPARRCPVRARGHRGAGPRRRSAPARGRCRRRAGPPPRRPPRSPNDRLGDSGGRSRGTGPGTACARRRRACPGATPPGRARRRGSRRRCATGGRRRRRPYGRGAEARRRPAGTRATRRGGHRPNGSNWLRFGSCRRRPSRRSADVCSRIRLSRPTCWPTTTPPRFAATVVERAARLGLTIEPGAVTERSDPPAGPGSSDGSDARPARRLDADPRPLARRRRSASTGATPPASTSTTRSSTRPSRAR